MRPTIRLRLTALYTAIFLAGSIILLGLAFALVSRNLSPSEAEVVQQIERSTGYQVGPGPGQGLQFRDSPGTRELFRAIQHDLRNRALRQLAVQFGAILGLMLIASIAAGWVLAGRALRPVRRITETARRVSEHTLSDRIGLEGPDDELREIADTFDSMLDRLERAFKSQKQFVANASHELRTPLAIMRTELDVTLSDPDASREDVGRMAETLREAVARSEGVIDALLVLAKGSAGPVRRERIDLAAVTRDALGRRGERAEDLTVTSEFNPAATVGDPALIGSLISNVIGNAVRHNRPHGWMDVKTWTSNGEATVEVTNSATRILDSSDVERIFEPFNRLDQSRQAVEGAGLGLSIVRAIATAHGGSATATPVDGGGLTVRVALPAATGKAPPEAEHAVPAGSSAPLLYSRAHRSGRPKG